MSDQIAVGMSEIMWVAEQADAFTWVSPVATDSVFLAGDGNFQQEPVLATNNEKQDSYSEQPKKIAYYKVGTCSFPVNAKLSGTAGTASPLAKLLKAVFGRETVNFETDVRYEHYRRSDEIKHLSIVHQMGFETNFITGAALSKLKMQVQADQIQKCEFAGLYLKSVVAGTDDLAEAVDGTTTPVTVIKYTSSEERFEVGARIVVGTDSNSGTGHPIENVNEATKEITIAEPGITTSQAAGVLITGWTPTIVAAGEEVVGELGWVKKALSGNSLVNVETLDTTYELDNGFKALEKEKKNSLYPGRICAGKRKVTLSVQKYLTKEDTNVKMLLKNYKQLEFEVNIGNEPGKIIQIVAENVRVEGNSISGSEEKTTDIKCQCYPNAGDDESVLILK